MKIEIKHIDGRWIVNGKSYDELEPKEKQFMNEFFKQVKIKSEPK